MRTKQMTRCHFVVGGKILDIGENNGFVRSMVGERKLRLMLDSIFVFAVSPLFRRFCNPSEMKISFATDLPNKAALK